MIKVLKKKLIITLVTVAVVGGVSIATFPMYHNVHTTIRKSQVSNMKEIYIKDITVDYQNARENDADKDMDSLSDEKISSDYSQNKKENINKQEIITSKLENSSDSGKKQESISPQPEKSNHNEDTNKQIATTSQLKDTNSNVNTENQGSVNATLEVKIPTIHYDRTTSIYANDNITLLRVEYYRNNKLTYYSVIEQFDATTKSYIEKIYQCNRETNIDPLIRTDVYVNNNLIQSY